VDRLVVRQRQVGDSKRPAAKDPLTVAEGVQLLEVAHWDTDFVAHDAPHRLLERSVESVVQVPGGQRRAGGTTDREHLWSRRVD
jgi:hypothetical protein